MRLMSVFTAMLVGVAIYFVILERDTLESLAQGTGAEVEESAEVEAEPRAQRVSVVAMRSTETVVDSALRLSGRTEAARNVDIRSETTGLVISEPIRKGEEISTGDLLCELDSGTRQASLAEANAMFREAEVNYTAASRLVERGFSSETDAVSRLAQLESAQAMVDQARKEIQRLRIVAPFDGILETDTAELGALLQPGGSCATLISLDPIKLVGFVPETEVERIGVGSPAQALLVTGQTIEGQVTFLARSADEATRTFRVEISVPNEDRAIRDGVSAEIMISLPGLTGHLLPLSALTLNDDGQLGVRVAVEGIARFAPVRIVRDTPQGVWVAGLSENADVIIVGQDFVRDGGAISVTYKEDQARLSDPATEGTAEGTAQ